MSSSQIPLSLPHETSFARVDFMTAPCNEAAVRQMDLWPGWPHAVMALVGPEGSGKSHLASDWAARAGARRFTPQMPADSLAGGDPVPLLIEDADRGAYAEDTVLHVYNWVRETGQTLLLTARTAPTRWPVRLPDLRSRLSTVPVMEIGPPDDTLLALLLAKLFADRQLAVAPDVVTYLLPRMERRFDFAHRLVALMDSRALSSKRAITIPLARDCLESLTSGL